MTRQEVQIKVTEYENSFPVENYRTYDWNVWPLLRSITAYNALIPQSRKAPSKNILTRILRHQAFKSTPVLRNIYCTTASYLLRKKLRKSLNSDNDKNSNLLSTGTDIVLLTPSGRRQMHQGCLYEIYTDPLVEHFTKRGINTIVWEKGEELSPRCHPSAWISRQLQIEALEAPPLKPIKRPDWFADFASLYHSTTGIHIDWTECEKTIQSVQTLSTVFEKWLLRSGARLLISVCWYDPVIMAATLASRRLNVPCVDLQHGLQDSDHFAYSGWQKVPTEAYELVPEYFWSWGTSEAKRLMLGNPAFNRQSKTIVGGNPWYNLWRENRDFCTALPDGIVKDRPRMKTILVTLQHGPANFTDIICEAIKVCPDEWFWLIRMHPATPPGEIEYIVNSLNSINCGNLEHTISSHTRLYTLLRNSNVHVTGHSTSALEALGFGVPTITVTKTGTIAFKEYIEAGVIQAAITASEIEKAISASTGISDAKCRDSVHEVFALTAEANKGIDELLSAANISE